MSEPVNSQYMTPEEYLKFDERDSERHEYVRGQIFAIAGSTQDHSMIVSNLVAAIHGVLRGTSCRVVSCDMRVRIETANCFYYPDLVVTCEPYKGKSIFNSAPRLVIEVLSPSTKQVDRREKIVAYKELSSLAQYVLVHQDRMKLEVHTRVLADRWQLTTHTVQSEQVELKVLSNKSLEMSLAMIYEGVEIPFVVEEEESEYELV